MMHIHLTLFDSSVYNDLIFFRDYLQKHPKAVKEYVKIKKEAIKKANGKGEIYRKHKKEFIEDILKKSI